MILLKALITSDVFLSCRIYLGNSYQINNLTEIDAVLVFMQAREVAAIVENEDEQGEP